MVSTDETKQVAEVCGSVLVSLWYCFCVGRWVNKGTKRLFLLIPVMFFFLLVPLHIYTPHVSGTIGFFISWLANFKLFLFAFGQGPLSETLSLPHFLLVSSFPIKLQNQLQDPKKRTREGPLLYGVKGLLLLCLLKTFPYFYLLPEKAVLILYGFTMYFALDLILALIASLVRVGSRLELEPQFNEPYLATSLQDFWGRRWNLMVSEILRPTVYEPLLRKCAPAVAAFATFVVSGVMHELIFFYMGRLRPSWRMMSFFLLHGSCIMIEIAIKKAVNRRYRLPIPLARSFTILFIFATGVWLFFPELKRCKADEKVFEDYAAVSSFLQRFCSTRFRRVQTHLICPWMLLLNLKPTTTFQLCHISCFVGPTTMF